MRHHFHTGNGVINSDAPGNIPRMEEHSLQKMVDFLEAKQEEDLKEHKTKAFAEKLDRVFFVAYLSLCVIYVFALVAIIQQEFCSENNLDFWKDW